MATYYCDPSLATGSNDGTSLANAWQSLEQVLRDTIVSGDYTGGDTIYIRSHDGASDITVTLSTGTYSQAVKGSYGNPVTWVADDGTIWPQGGTLTVIKSDDGQYFTLSDYNVFQGAAHNFVIKAGNGAAHSRTIRASGTINSLIFNDVELASDNGGGDFLYQIMLLSSGNYTFNKCKFSVNTTYDGSSGAGLVLSNYIFVDFIDCEFDLLNHNGALSSTYLIYCYGLSVQVRFIGGRVINGNSSHKLIKTGAIPMNSISGNTIYSNGLDIGATQPLRTDYVESFPTQTTMGTGWQIIEEAINGKNSFALTTLFGEMRWSSGENFPTLNAVEPDSAATPWSIRVMPSNGINQQNPFQLSVINKFYNGADAILTITLELLIKDTAAVGGSGKYDSPLKSDWWIDVVYVRASDTKTVVESSFDTAALATSSAAWSTTGYGAQNYVKYKASLTTSVAVKADRIIGIFLYSGRPTNNTTDFYFVCPDPTLVAA